MPKISALIHTHNDGERIGRALDSLCACDEILVIDHASADNTVDIARDHGAEVKEGVPGVNPGVYAMDARYDWILCLLPTESASEALQASLLEWKGRKEEGTSFQDEKDTSAGAQYRVSVAIREETGNGWRELGTHTRLANRKKVNWPGHLPPDDPQAEVLPGHMLRFSKP